jgi:hypothetical protein
MEQVIPPSPEASIISKKTHVSYSAGIKLRDEPASDKKPENPPQHENSKRLACFEFETSAEKYINV